MIKVKFAVKCNLLYPPETKFYLLGNTPPLTLKYSSSVEMKKVGNKLYEVFVNFPKSQILNYHYAFVKPGIKQEAEERPMNGPNGYREIDTSMIRGVEDEWEKPTFPYRKPPCAFLWRNPVVSWDGKVTVCCNDHHFLLSLGNIKEIPLREMWEGEKIDKLRLLHIMGDFCKTPLVPIYKVPVCLFCWNSPGLPKAEVIDYLKSKGWDSLIPQYLERVFGK